MAALALTAVLAGCSGGGVLSSLKGGSTSAQSISRPAVESAELQFTHPAAGDTIAVFDTSAGIFKAVLFPDEAPQAVQNFTTLAGQGFYNGLTVTRVEKDFVVEAGQGADGRGTTIWNGRRDPPPTPAKLRAMGAPLPERPAATPPRPPISSTITPVPSVRQRTPRANAPAFSTSWRRCRAQTQ